MRNDMDGLLLTSLTRSQGMAWSVLHPRIPFEGDEMKIAVVTDSAADLPRDVQKHVYIVPIRVLFGEDQFRDHVDLTPGEFFDKLRTSKVLPTTSQPSPADFIQIYRELLKDYERIVSLHISSKLSGTYQAAYHVH